MKPTRKAFTSWCMAEWRSLQSVTQLRFIRDLVDDAKIYYSPASDFIRDLRAGLSE